MPSSRPGRPPPLPRLPAPPFAPRSTADGAQRQPRHPLQRLLLDSPEGPSFAQRARLDYTLKSGSDRTLTLGHTKIESTVRYLGIEVDDALAIAEQVDV